MSHLTERVPKTVLVGGAILAAVALRQLYRAMNPPKKLQSGNGLSVVVTGCDTGFGNMTARQLAAKGFTVFAGCLTDKGVEGLRIQNVRPFKMDVTKDSDVKASRAMLEKECPGGIYALINNAGVHSGYKWELTPMDAVYKDMEVNYFGVVRVTMQLLPLLRKFVATAKSSNGKVPPPRVVTITSIAGTIKAAPLGSYMASKHAAQVFGVTLRQELHGQGILSAMIEPYYAKTPLVTAIDQRKIDRALAMPADVVAVYGGPADITKRMARNAFHTYIPEADLLDPQVVVDVLLEQTCLWRPEIHNLVGRAAHFLSLATRLAPARMLDAEIIKNDNVGI